MMKSSQEEARLQLIGAAKNLGIGLGASKKDETPWQSIKSTYRTDGLWSAFVLGLGLLALFAAIGGGILLAALLVAASLSILRGYVLVQLWGWFIVPLGVPNIGFVHAIGISTVISFIALGLKSDLVNGESLKRMEKRILKAFDKVPDEKKEWKFLLGKLVMQYVAAVFALGVGYVIHLYM